MAVPATEPVSDAEFDALVERLGLPAELASAAKALYDGQQALGPALSAVRVPVSPQLARSMQATENVWRSVAREFGLLSAADVGELLSGRRGRDLAHRMRAQGQLMAARRSNAFRYPGFQFTAAGGVRSWVAPLASLAAEANWPEADVLLWMVSPSGRLSGRRPVDIMDDVHGLLTEAKFHIGDMW